MRLPPHSLQALSTRPWTQSVPLCLHFPPVHTRQSFAFISAAAALFFAPSAAAAPLPSTVVFLAVFLAGAVFFAGALFFALSFAAAAFSAAFSAAFLPPRPPPSPPSLSPPPRLTTPVSPPACSTP